MDVGVEIQVKIWEELVEENLGKIYIPRSPYCEIRSILDRTLICGSSSWSMARSERRRTEIYFEASVI